VPLPNPGVGRVSCWADNPVQISAAPASAPINTCVRMLGSSLVKGEFVNS
jgi:hypothetical protein